MLKMEKATTLQIFDLDETLFRMPGYTSKTYVESLGYGFGNPYEFYDHPKSLCEEVHNIQLIKPVYDFWKEGLGKDDVASVLITHRVAALEPEVTRILEKRGIVFDKMFFLGRVKSKTDAVAEVLTKLPNVKEIRVFEDSIQQLGLYQDYFHYMNSIQAWAEEPLIEIKLYIVDKSKMYRIENFKLSEKTRIILT